MRYSTTRAQQNVTPLEDLPELEELDGRSNFSNGLSADQSKKVSNKIRQNFTLSTHSGMSPINQDDSSSRERARQNPIIHNIRQDNNSKEEMPHQKESYSSRNDQKQQHDNHNVIEEHFKNFNMPIGSPSCLDVAEHISKCPICSKFYNTDKTIYIIAIITLAIICILLLKKVLDV